MTVPATSRHILLLNNSYDVLRLLSDLLQAEGYRVTSHRWVDRNIPALIGDRPDLIILDYQWATDDDGWTLLQLLRLAPETAITPIILCTAAVGHVRETEDHLREMNIDVVFKPFDIDRLLGVVRTRLVPFPAGVPAAED